MVYDIHVEKRYAAVNSAGVAARAGEEREMDGEEPQDEGEEALDHLPEEDEILSVTVDGED